MIKDISLLVILFIVGVLLSNQWSYLFFTGSALTAIWILYIWGRK